MLASCFFKWKRSGNGCTGWAREGFNWARSSYVLRGNGGGSRLHESLVIVSVRNRHAGTGLAVWKRAGDFEGAESVNEVGSCLRREGIDGLHLTWRQALMLKSRYGPGPGPFTCNLKSFPQRLHVVETSIGSFPRSSTAEQLRGPMLGRNRRWAHLIPHASRLIVP